MNYELIRQMERAENLSHLNRLDSSFRPIAEVLQGYPGSPNIRLSRLSDRVKSRLYQRRDTRVSAKFYWSVEYMR